MNHPHTKISIPAFLRRQWPFATLWVLFSLFENIATILLLLSIGPCLGLLQPGADGSKSRALQLIGIDAGHTASHFFLFFFGVLLAKLLCSIAGKWLGALLSERWHGSLQQQLFAAQAAAPHAVLLSRPVSEHLLPYTHDMKTLRRLLLKGWLGLVKDGLLLCMALGILFRLQALATAWLIAGLLLAGWLYRLTGMVLKNKIAEGRNNKAALLRFIGRRLQELITGNRGRNAVSRLHKRIAAQQDNARGRLAAHALLDALPPFLLYALLGLLLLGMVTRPDWRPADVLSYILLLLYILPTLRALVKVQQVWLTGTMALQSLQKRIQLLIAAETETGKNNFSENNVTSLHTTATDI
jgi:ABC-type multidrug transport system fused ATPase/permease subunit